MVSRPKATGADLAPDHCGISVPTMTCDDPGGHPEGAAGHAESGHPRMPASGSVHRVTSVAERRGVGLPARTGKPTRKVNSGLASGGSRAANRGANVGVAPVADSRSMRSVIWFM